MKSPCIRRRSDPPNHSRPPDDPRGQHRRMRLLAAVLEDSERCWRLRLVCLLLPNKYYDHISDPAPSPHRPNFG